MKKELIQLGVHPSVHVAEVFSSPRPARLVHRLGLTPGLAFDLRTGWNLHDPAPRAKNVVTFATRKANFDCWELEWTQYWDATHEVDDGLSFGEASCSRTFLCTPIFWKVVSESRVFVK